MLRNSPEVRFDPDMRFGEDHDLWMKIVAKYPVAHLDFNAYRWTQGSPDGIGKMTDDWKERSQANKANGLARYVGGHHSTKMRIAVFCDAFGMHPYGGPAIYGYNVAEMLYRGRNPFVMFYNPSPTEHPHSAYYRREEHLLPRSKDVDIDGFDVFYAMNSLSVVRMLNEKGISPIIGSNHITNSAPEHCLQFLDEKQLIHRGHFIEHEKAFLKNHVGKFWFAQSKFQISEYQRVGMNLDEITVYLAPNPLDTELFRRRQDYGDYIVWSGKNNWAKGVPFLSAMTDAFPDQAFKVLWGGEGNDFPPLSNNVEIVMGSTLFQIPEHHEAGKVFLSTSVTENQPCAVLEAMSMELPIVGFNTSGMPEIVENGETGFLVELGDANALAEKMDILLRDESLRREMGKKARRFVMENFSYYNCLDKYLSYFKRYLEE
jgi:glycosyltransferase involved in cell wall biosynthesis